MDIKTLIGDYRVFLDRVFENLKLAGIKVGDYELDHIAYRATTAKSYQSISQQLVDFGERVLQNIIRNRPVDIYFLNQPLMYDDQRIVYFEVLAPAEGDKFPEGLEHAEFIIDEDLHDFVKRYPKLKWNINSIDREIGAEVALYFDDWANPKFKTMSMEEVVKLEKLKK